MSRFDRFVGEVVAELRRQGVFDDTFIVVMADNGRPFARAKTRLLPDGIHTPFIVRYPAGMRAKAGVCNSLVSVVDLAPTLTDVAGVATPRAFQGRSFASLLAHPDRKFRTYAFAEHNWHDFEACERMVCTERYLLIENARPWLSAVGAADVVNSASGRSLFEAYAAGRLDSLQADIFITPRPSVELYDYRADPEQLENLAAREIRRNGEAACRTAEMAGRNRRHDARQPDPRLAFAGNGPKTPGIRGAPRDAREKLPEPP